MTTGAIGSISTPTCTPSLPTATRSSPRPGDRAMAGLTETLTRIAAGHSVLAGIQRAGSPAADRELLQSAATKLAAALFAFTSNADVTDALGVMLAQQTEQSTARRQVAKTQIKTKLKQAQAQTLKELKQIEKQIEEAKSSSFWDSFCKVFQAIATVVGTAASVVSGNPLLMAGSALAIGSLVGSYAPGDLGLGLGLGLGLAGSAFSLTGAFVNVEMYKAIADAGIKAAVNTSLSACTAMANGNAAVGRIPAGVHQYLSQTAAAEAKSAEVAGETFRKEAADEREVLRAMVATQQRAVELVMGAVEIHDRADRAAHATK